MLSQKQNYSLWLLRVNTVTTPYAYITLHTWDKTHTANTPVTLISNQQESSRTSRNEEFSKFAPHSGGNFKPSHNRGGMSRNDDTCGMEIIYIFLYRYAIRRCSELRPDSFEGQSGRSDWIRAAFERQSKDSDDIWIAFQLNSCNIEIDSGSNRNAFEVHSGSFEAHSGHSGRIWSGLPFRFSFEGDQNVSNIVGMP